MCLRVEREIIMRIKHGKRGDELLLAEIINEFNIEKQSVSEWIV
jgi:hypothetical protein